MKKSTFYVLMTIIVLEAFLILSYVGIDNTQIADLQQENEGLRAKNESMEALLEQATTKGEEFRQANLELAEMCKRYCPEGSVADPK